MTSSIWREWIPARSWFLFNTWFSLLVICVSAAVALHVSIGRAAWPILIFCSGPVIVLAIRSHRTRRTKALRWRSILSSVLVLGAVVVVLWGSLIKGEFVSIYPDPWNYSVFAAYIQHPVLAISGGSQPILSIGSLFMGTRYGTAGLLALFAEISRTDTCQAASIFACVVLVQTGLGFTLLARALRAGPLLSLGAGLFGVAIGWVPEILKIGNWDQVLFVSFIPYILVRIRFLSFQTSRKSGVFALGMCLGATVFVYPEGAAISGVIYLPMLVWRLFRGHDPLGKIRKLAIATGVGLLVSSVYLPTFVSFLFFQISASGTLLANGTFSGLLSRRWLPAVYCLGQHLPLATLHKLKRVDLIVPLLFVGLTSLALGAWWKKKDRILLTIPTFLLLSLWQTVLLRYDYGMYKVLTMFWPVLVVAIFVGMSQLLTWCRGFARPVAAVAFCALTAEAVSVEVDAFQYAPWREECRIKPFFELTNLKKISGTSTISICTQSWFNQCWALFFLRGYKVEVPNPLLFLGGFLSAIQADTNEQSKEALILTDEKKLRTVWHNEIFSLLEPLKPVEVMTMDAPNSVETIDGDSFIWLDNRFANLTVNSDADRHAVLVIRQCWPGPSRPNDTNRTLIVEVNGAKMEVPTSQNLKIPVTLKKGNNQVRLSCKIPPTVNKLPSGDSRTLLLGIKGFTVMTAD
jgi:hypothetical protein